MTPFPVTIDENKLAALDQLITAAGKSPATNGQMMLLAADMLRWLESQMNAAQKPAEPPKMVKDAA